jgi:hypothetical protein
MRFQDSKSSYSKRSCYSCLLSLNFLNLHIQKGVITPNIIEFLKIKKYKKIQIFEADMNLNT